MIDLIGYDGSIVAQRSGRLDFTSIGFAAFTQTSRWASVRILFVRRFHLAGRSSYTLSSGSCSSYIYPACYRRPRLIHPDRISQPPNGITNDSLCLPFFPDELDLERVALSIQERSNKNFER